MFEYNFCKNCKTKKISSEFQDRSNICFSCLKIINYKKESEKNKLLYSYKKKKISNRNKLQRNEFTAESLIKNINRHHHKKNFKLSEFREWFNKQKKVCFYCDITPDEYLSKKIYKKYNATKNINRFTIDRKNSSINYIINNIVLCCPLCNYVKSYFFSAEEFKEISQKYIKPLYNIND